MVSSDILKQFLPNTLRETRFEHLGIRYSGKVRDTYDADGRLILVTTDRISAFDHVLRQTIPFKGQVLNKLAAYFFAHTADVMDNHVLEIPDPNVTVARKCQPQPLEFVIRAYLVGHAWRIYRTGARILCGKRLPDGLLENSRLPEPILTPSTKAQEGHDEDISRAEILQQNLMNEDTFDMLEQQALKLFERGTQMAEKRGLILVDTKYEFGRSSDGRFLLIDEIHTPDSSRYFYADSYDELLRNGKPQRQLSKEFVREWLMARGFQGKSGQVLPDLDDSFRIEVAQRYIELYETVTGDHFEPDLATDPVSRVASALNAQGTSAQDTKSRIQESSP